MGGQRKNLHAHNEMTSGCKPLSFGQELTQATRAHREKHHQSESNKEQIQTMKILVNVTCNSRGSHRDQVLSLVEGTAEPEPGLTLRVFQGQQTILGVD